MSVNLNKESITNFLIQCDVSLGIKLANVSENTLSKINHVFAGVILGSLVMNTPFRLDTYLCIGSVMMLLNNRVNTLKNIYEFQDLKSEALGAIAHQAKMFKPEWEGKSDLEIMELAEQILHPQEKYEDVLTLKKKYPYSTNEDLIIVAKCNRIGEAFVQGCLHGTINLHQ